MKSATILRTVRSTQYAILLLLCTACFPSREEAFYAAAARVEQQIADEWGGAIEVIGPPSARDFSFMDSKDGREYVRWRLMNMQRHADMGQRLRPPDSVPEDWVRHWAAALDAFTAQGNLAFRGTRTKNLGLVLQAVDLCEVGWTELARRDQVGQ